ncbi:A/G-specific adenine glycosylase [Colletotrichum tofieldiae]|uniref:Adenine DNA glycosylase n=1 Tax=Colletotrichum tofieldiae TaxID=708197 RepID=A0A166W2F5_9PEZI|nr:A/G-specific adenine glycosylase [Colletotrichum tofieldiae]GKT66012.1 A/G-specific adenine glycosylase [Colletotrichum tofieldiae]GKT70811.1 A/G-specific adenine glycosylase [Colletotrichum tofieldiae]GKT94294.1 A/G-specific adenine glycosylase [Colletotrichum tofieldiae]
MIQRSIARRQSSLAAAKRILAQADDEPDNEPLKPISRTRKAAAKAPPPPAREDAFEADFTPLVDDDEVNETAEPQPKRRKVEKTRKADTAKLHASLFGPSGQATREPCSPPSRTHAATYHRPLLLDGRPGRDGRDALLAWFDSTSTTRGMPWRKAWIDPRDPPDAAGLRTALEKRAYEVWISEIMLQQTRVAVVIDYWNRWMARWPTIQDLAAAEPEDVLSAWRGLGYYSRATRIHEAAKLVVKDPTWKGLMPDDTAELEAKVPGVGRYTAGAISAIVFGRAAPMVDGNVLRVLSRQLGVFGNAKTDKAVIDLLWAAADALVKAVAQDGPDNQGAEGEEAPTSDRPGRWGQALMELGSTLCTPKPNCGECPVTSTCRAYAEGLVAAAKPKKAAKVEDIEDLCSICEPFEEAAEEAAASGDDSDADAPKPAKGAKKGTKSRPVAKQATLSAFFSSKTAKKEEPPSPKRPAVDAKTLETIADHAKRFPLKAAKKAVREEEALVCAVRRADGRFLIHRRPDKGLLAGMWELPSHTLPAATSNTASSRKRDAQGYMSGLLGDGGEKPKTTPRVRHAGDLGSVPWLFSHLKLTMHVHLFEVEGAGEYVSSHSRHRWATAVEVDEESMGTGMRKCWALVRERIDE